MITETRDGIAEHKQPRAGVLKGGFLEVFAAARQPCEQTLEGQSDQDRPAPT